MHPTGAVEAALAQQRRLAASLAAALRAAHGQAVAEIEAEADFGAEEWRRCGYEAALYLVRAAVAQVASAVAEVDASTPGLDPALAAARRALAALDDGLTGEIPLATAMETAIMSLAEAAKMLDAVLAGPDRPPLAGASFNVLRAVFVAGAAFDAALDFARDLSAEAETVPAGIVWH